MSTLRFQALKKTLNRKPVEVEEPARRSEIFGKNVFNEVYDQGRLAQNGYVGIVRSNDRSEFGLRYTKSFDLY